MERERGKREAEANGLEGLDGLDGLESREGTANPRASAVVSATQTGRASAQVRRRSAVVLVRATASVWVRMVLGATVSERGGDWMRWSEIEVSCLEHR